MGKKYKSIESAKLERERGGGLKMEAELGNPKAPHHLYETLI